MINQWLERQDDIVLARLASVKSVDWNSMNPTYGSMLSKTSTDGCLICHAFNCREAGEYSIFASLPSNRGLSLAFMHEVGLSSDEQVGAEISAQAESILARRCVEDVIADLPIRANAVNSRPKIAPNALQ